jgi:hypothetical protein
MAKRVSRRRLYNLSKTGISSGSFAPGTGITGSIAGNTQFRDGSLITTEVLIDLANSVTGALSSPGIAALVVGPTNSGSAVIGQILPFTHGVVTSVEVICTEAPLPANQADIDFVAADEYFTAFSGGLTNITAIGAPAGAWVVGQNTVTDLDSNAADGQYIYMNVGHTTDGLGGADFTAGKFVLRLYGYAIATDL